MSHTNEFKHISVLLEECITALAIKPDGIYIDATFGRGGHSNHILNTLGDRGQLIAFDRDPQAIEAAKTQHNASDTLVGIATTPSVG